MQRRYHNIFKTNMVEHSLEFIEPKGGNLLKEYFRNNKSMGIKNIQCFPICVSEDKQNGIHKVGRSCVGSVVVKYKYVAPSPIYGQEQIHAFAKFTTVKGMESNCKDKQEAFPALENLFRVTGTRIPKTLVSSHQLNRNNRLGVLFIGNLKKSRIKPSSEPSLIEYEFEFEFRPRTWHYGWRGGRYRKSEHIMEIGICIVDKDNMYSCCASISTTPFRVMSNRTLKNRRKRLNQDSAQSAKNAASRKPGNSNVQKTNRGKRKVKARIAANRENECTLVENSYKQHRGAASRERFFKTDEKPFPYIISQQNYHNTCNSYQGQVSPSHLTKNYYPQNYDGLDGHGSLLHENGENKTGKDLIYPHQEGDIKRDEMPPVGDLTNAGDFRSELFNIPFDSEHLQDPVFPYYAH